jgi:hypothetical protein
MRFEVERTLFFPSALECATLNSWPIKPMVGTLWNLKLLIFQHFCFKLRQDQAPKNWDDSTSQENLFHLFFCRFSMFQDA